jgi:hypothetical protein
MIRQLVLNLLEAFLTLRKMLAVLEMGPTG